MQLRKTFTSTRVCAAGWLGAYGGHGGGGEEEEESRRVPAKYASPHDDEDTDGMLVALLSEEGKHVASHSTAPLPSSSPLAQYNLPSI